VIPNDYWCEPNMGPTCVLTLKSSMKFRFDLLLI
jgi:hypothetical protein